MPPTKTSDSVPMIQRDSSDRVAESVKLGEVQKCLCDGVFIHQPDLRSGCPMTMCDLPHERTVEHIRAGPPKTTPGSTRHADFSPRGEDKGGKRSWRKDRGVKTSKSKECHFCVTSSHNRREYRILSTTVRQKFAQRGRTIWHASRGTTGSAPKEWTWRDLLTSWTNKSSMRAMMVGVRTCLPLSLTEESDDGFPRQVRTNLRTAKSVVPPVFKSDGQVEPTEKVPAGSKSLSESGGARQVEREPGVRSVVGSIVVAGHGNRQSLEEDWIAVLRKSPRTRLLTPPPPG